MERGARGSPRRRSPSPGADGSTRHVDVSDPSDPVACDPARRARETASVAAAVARRRHRVHGEQSPSRAGRRIRACLRRQSSIAGAVHDGAGLHWRGARVRCPRDARPDGAGHRVPFVSGALDPARYAVVTSGRAGGAAVWRDVRRGPRGRAAPGAVARAIRARDPDRVAGPAGGARRRHGRGPRGRPHGAEAPRAVRGDAVLVVGALAHERPVVRGVLPGVRGAGAERRNPPAARDPRVRGGGPGVGRLLRRLRESDAADVAALRHQSEPGAGVRGRLSRFHVPADHAARPALACECPPPPGRPGSGTDGRSTGGRETVTDAVRVAAHAKLNLLLRILAREAPAGYHQIETAFALLELADELMVTRTASGVALTVQGPDLGAPEQNLAVRAARAVLEATGHKFGVALELTKRIPVRSGLGGGSSDAAAALHAVNTLAGNAVPRHELLHVATRLGADVAFFAGAVAAVYANEGLRDDAASQLGEKHQRLIKTATKAATAPGPEPLP